MAFAREGFVRHRSWSDRVPECRLGRISDCPLRPDEQESPHPVCDRRDLSALGISNWDDGRKHRRHARRGKRQRLLDLRWIFGNRHRHSGPHLRMAKVVLAYFAYRAKRLSQPAALR